MSNLTGNYKIGGGDVQGVDVLREREQERRARLQLLDDIREPSPQPIFGEPVKVDLEDETSRRIKNTLGDFTQVLVNDPKNLIGISRISSSSGHQMNGHPSNGYSSSSYAVSGYSMSSGGHQTASHQTSGYSSNNYAGSGYGSSALGHYNRAPAVKKPPPYVVNGACAPKTSMPNYISPKAPDKRQGYNRPEKTGYYKPESPAAAPKTFHSSNSQPYHGQDSRPKDHASWDKDQRRTNSSQPLAVNINVNVESSTNLTINNINLNNNTISTSAPIWTCGADTPAVQIAPFHLPSSATPSVPAKNAANYGQTSTSLSSTPTTAKNETQSSTPTKRNLIRPSSLKIQPEKKSAEAPIAVETILKEMTKAVPPAPLTAIQTPRTEETGFAFPTDPTNEESFMKLEEQVHLLTPLDDDPMPNDVHQSSPNSWWTSPDIKPEMKYSQAECKVTDSTTYELSKLWKKPNESPAPEVAPPEIVESLSLEPSQKVADSDAKYGSSSLQDDLEMSDSDEEVVVPEEKRSPIQYIKSPILELPETIPTIANTTNSAMESNSAESSNSSSSDSGESDSDDSSSESNDSDSSSEASDEEISSKKWGLSNFVDESQRIHSPAFFNNDPAAKESFRLHAERMKNFVIGNINPLNGASSTSNILPSAAIGSATFLVPDVPVSTKSDLLSPIPSPVHTAVGPRTPPSPSCPLKESSSDVNNEPVTTDLEKSENDNTFAVNNRSDEPQVSCDSVGEKISEPIEKFKKQLRSGKNKSDDLSSEHESSHLDSSVDEPSDPKELSDRSLESDKLATAPDKNASDSVSAGNSESSPENYSIKTRQRVSAATSAKKTKSTGDNSNENNQKTDVAIAKLKHPRACRKSNEKQTKKASTITSAKPSVEESKKPSKPETKETPSEKVKEPLKVSGKTKNIPKISMRSQSKVSKSSPKPAVETKKTDVKKKKKKFSMENFLQSPENENARLSNSLPPFTPSPERSPIPDCPNASEAAEEPPDSPVLPSRTPGRPSSKNTAKGKKVEKLRRSVRCSERASISAQADTSNVSQSTPENTKNSKTVGKAKRNIENLPISMEPPIELLSPIPQDPPLCSKASDSVIPRKIMVCIPLAKILRLPVFQQDQESAAKQAVKNISAIEDIRTQKKDGNEKPSTIVTPKQSQTKDLSEKAASTPKNTKNGTKTVPSNKKAKASKPVNEISKTNATTDANKTSIKVKDKTLNEAVENKFSKKRKNDGVEKQTAKKPKLPSRTTDEKKQKEQPSALKSDSMANQLDSASKSKGLERCDSTGSLSSLCSQQSQRSSKSSKEKKKDSSSSTPESKRIKTSMSPLLSLKDIKQEKEDKLPKNRNTLDARMQLDKNKSKLRDKATVKDMTGPDQFWDDCFSSQFWDEQYKEDIKGKMSGSSLDMINRELADWENFAPDMHKDIKGASALNKHNNQAPIMPMDYFWTEGKKQLYLAEKEKDPFQQAVKYFEAVVLFILTSQQREEYSKDTDSVYNIYGVTLKLTVKLLQKIKKLQSCPGSTEFKLLILCLKSQSLLNVKHYNLKIKEVKEELEGVNDFLKHQCSASLNSNQSRVGNAAVVPPHSPIPSPASSVNSQSSNYNSNSVPVPQSILDMICRQHTHLINLHKGHDLWEQADMYMTRSNLREFFKEVADQSEPLTLHSSITELVKYIQKGISLVKKSLR
ncbi:AF4/FMR2 family member 3-like isoform X1 [Argiope bruennichi]|uniref:AF4/FMR2 family member lilli n=1 Tax=Argiope bruennichi TaxID=94029 RepID=A0A8T0FM12_ARGBR|nr:AF4/FMR2 family member 3-like isoform X1 [Argiope bruennichi]KAF8790440.1 AF4/FMR2 family member lilli like protein [Argiope bruennichi]